MDAFIAIVFEECLLHIALSKQSARTARALRYVYYSRGEGEIKKQPPAAC